MGDGWMMSFLTTFFRYGRDPSCEGRRYAYSLSNDWASKVCDNLNPFSFSISFAGRTFDRARTFLQTDGLMHYDLTPAGIG